MADNRTSKLKTLCNYFCSLQNQIIKANNDIAVVTDLFEKNIDDIYRQWNEFCSLTYVYIDTCVTYYNNLSRAEEISLLKFNPNNKSEEDLNSTMDNMKMFVVLTYIIRDELLFLETGLIPAENNLGDFLNFAQSFSSLMDRKTDLRILYKFEKYADRIVIKDDENQYSCLSLNGLEYLYIQLSNMIKICCGVNVDSSLLHIPFKSKDFERIFNDLLDLRRKNNIQMGNKDHSVFKKALHMTRHDENGTCSLTLKVSFCFNHLYFKHLF
jgi:hypothetical protein